MIYKCRRYNFCINFAHFVSALVLVCILMQSFLSTQNVKADSTNTYNSEENSSDVKPLRTVKVGFYEKPGYLEGASDGRRKSGYSFGFLQNIADYAGWQLEYVYGDKAELLKEMMEGRIDLVPGVVKDERFLDYLDYSIYSIYSEDYILYLRNSNELLQSDYTFLDASSVAMSKDYEYLIDEWLDKIGHHPKIKFYNSDQCAYEGFLNKETDAFISTSNFFTDEMIYAMNIDTISFYIAVSKKSEDLGEEMNKAIMSLLASKSGLLDDLRYKYLQTDIKVKKLSNDEQQWLDKNMGITVGVLNEDMPYSIYDPENDSAKGLVRIFMDSMTEALSLTDCKVNYVFYDTYEQMINALINEDVDVAYPVVSYSDVAERMGYMYTEPIASCMMAVVYRNSIDLSNIGTVAYNCNLLAPYYAEEILSGISYINCETRAGALEAVALGTAECALMNGYSTDNLLITDPRFMTMHSLSLPTELELCLGVKRGNTSVFSLMNRGVSNVSKKSLDNNLSLLLAKESIVPYEQLYLITHRNAIVALIVSLLIFCIIAVCFASIGIKNRRYSVKLKRTSEELVKEAVSSANRETIISSLADKYELVVYYDSIKDSTKILRCKGLFANFIDAFTSTDEQGNQINRYLDSFKITSDDVEKFLYKYVMPEDHDTFRNAFKIDTISSLLQKKGNFYITYRILVNGEPKHYRTNFAVDHVNSACIVIGFADVDDEIRREAEQASEEQRRSDILKECLDCTLVRSNTDESIMQMLELIAGFFDADRAYIFETNRDKTFISNTYEWCRFGVESEKSSLQQIELNKLHDWIEVFKEQGSVYISSLEEDLSGSSYSYDLFKRQGINNALISPLFIGDNFEGFVGVDNQKTSVSDVRTLSSIASILLSMILRGRQAGEERQIIDRMTETYLAVFYANLETGYLRNYTIIEELSSTYGIATDYQTAVNLFIENDVARRFKDEVSQFLEPQNIIEQLKTKNELVYSYMGKLKENLYNIELKVLKADKEGKCAVISFIDRTEQVRKELEYQEELVAAKNQAEAASIAKSKFLSKMSHDIRTPMNGVIGMTAIAEKYIDDKYRVIDCLHKIDSASQHLLALINDVLDMSQIESGRVVLNLKPINFESFFATCFSIVEWQLKDKCINLVTENEPFKHQNVLADELRLRQIVINILGNAIKFTPPNGSIFFRSSEEVVGHNRVHYHGEIEDTGIGMKPEFLDRIFEEFAQEDEGTRTHYKGSGLGMPIAKQLIEMMGGSIDVKSVLNKGTTFIVDLELTLCDAVEESISEEKVMNFEGRHVLVVEDNEINLEITNEILRSQGMTVSSAMDGQEAVDLFSISSPFTYDAILMDIMMPVMDGFEATRRIRALDRPDSEVVPIIAMTANAFAEDVAHAFEAGMNDHLSKPVVVELLLKTLAKQMNR